MRIRVKIILALLIGTFCFTTYGVQAANVQASKEKMSGYGRSEKARKELKKREEVEESRRFARKGAYPRTAAPLRLLLS